MKQLTTEELLRECRQLKLECNLALSHESLADKHTELEDKYKEKEKENIHLRDENNYLNKCLEETKEKLKLPKEPVEKNILTVNIKATEIDEVKDIIASFIFMLEDNRKDRDIRLQYLESCKKLKECYFVRIDK